MCGVRPTLPYNPVVTDDLPASTPDGTSGPEPVSPTGTFGLVMLVGSELTELLERLLRRHGTVTLAQFRMIELMSARHPERLEPWQLAETLGLASNHVSMLLDQLETRQLVKRHAHPRDRRRRLIEITAAGQEQATRLAELTRGLEQRVLDAALNADQGAQLTDLLERLRAELIVLASALRRRPGP